MQEDLTRFKDDFVSAFNSREYSYMLISPLHFLLNIEIYLANVREEIINFEQLCEQIPRKFGSRSTVKEILKHGVEFKYLVKSVRAEDKRLRAYEHTERYKAYVRECLDILVFKNKTKQVA